jgi:hypothetical protein
MAYIFENHSFQVSYKETPVFDKAGLFYYILAIRSSQYWSTSKCVLL